MANNPSQLLAEQNVPDNFLARLGDLELRVTDLELMETPQVEEIIDGKVSIFDMGLSPAEGVTVADPTSTSYTGVFIAGDGVLFGSDYYVLGSVQNGVIKAGFLDDGTLYAEDANISGTIIIGAGSSAGGWLIDATRIYSLASNIGIAMDSSVPIIRVGDIAGVHIQIDGANQRIRSSNFVTGISGSNWDTASGNAEFNYIVANGGTVGGWDIGLNSLTASAGAVGLSSAITGGDDIRIWAGHATPASAPFYVTESGALFASSATISGTITATAGTIGGWSIDATRIYNLSSNIGIAMDSSIPAIKVGNTAGDYIIIDGANQRIRSSNYVAGALGSNWDTATGDLEVNNLVARGELRTFLLTSSNQMAVSGSIIVSKDAGKVAAAVGSGDTTIDFGKSMTVGDWVKFQGADATGSNSLEWVLVGSNVSGTIYNVTRNVDGSGANSWADDTPFVVIGQNGDSRIEMVAGSSATLRLITQGATWNTFTIQAEMSTVDGAITAGAGDVRLDNSGVSVVAGNDSSNKIRWINGDSNQIVEMYALDVVDVEYAVIGVDGNIDFPGAWLTLQTNDFGTSSVTKIIIKTDAGPSITFSANDGSIDAQMILHNIAGTPTLTIAASTTINSGGSDLDTIIKGNTDDTLTVWDAGEDNVTIGGVAASGYKLAVDGLVYVRDASDVMFSRLSNAAGTETTINNQAVDSNTRIKGSGDHNLIYVHASTNRVGIGEDIPGYKLDVDGDVNTSGVYRVGGTTVISSTVTGVTNGDSHDHNGGDGAAIVEAAITLADNTTNNATTTAHGFLLKATAPASGLMNFVGITNGETVYSNKPLFDTTNPAALGTAAPGTSLIAAHRDHVHATLITAEQATFTPRIDGTATAGSGTYTTQLGYYTRIGNTVFVDIELVWTAHTGTGNMTIEGLPVTSNANVSAILSVFFSNITLSAAGNKVLARVLVSTTSIQLTEVGGGAAAALALDTAATIRLSGFYFV